MTRYAFLNPNGFPAYVTHIGSSPDYEEGQSVDGLIVRAIPEGTDISDFLANWYWEDEWKQRLPQKNQWERYNQVTKMWTLDGDAFFSAIRARRNQLLASSDWTQLSDSPLSDEQKKAWVKYREALRNMTNDDYSDGNFPQMPS